MKIIIFLFSLFLFQTQKITVLSSNTKEPIEAASVYAFKSGQKIYIGQTSENGEFYFNDDYDFLIIHSIGYDDFKYEKNNKSNVIYLDEKVNTIDEVIISKGKKIIIGEYKKRASETRVISVEKNQFAILFKDIKNRELNLNSILLNVKKTSNTATVVFNFYPIDSIERNYKSYSKNSTQTTLKELIPNTKGILSTFQYKLETNLKNKIIEINLDSLKIKIPKEGIFISVFTKEIYDINNNKIPIKSIAQLPEIYKHKTKENNYCIIMPSKDSLWQNINLVQKFGEDNDDFHPIIPLNYFEPSIGIKAREIKN
jgi:hypothetical protein